MTHYGGAQDGMDPSSPSFGTSVGSCGYGMIPKDAFPYFSVAAFSPENHYYKSGPSGACGQCFQIQCVNGRNGKDYCKTDAQGQALSILVMISDVCPECEAEHMDVQSLAFGKLADQGLGNINMRYRRVECNIPKNIEVDVMNFGGGGQWLRLAITDTGGYASVQSVSVKSSSGSNWQTMDNTWGAVWESGSAPQAPLDFQITCSDGQIVTADSVVTQDGGISGGVGGAITFTTDVQFNIDDPAASSVQSFDGPEDPMVVTSTTPGNSDSTEGGSSTSSGSATTNSTTSSSSANSTSTTSPAASSSCSDTDAPGGYSCQQQKDWGKCDSELFTSNNYCAETCGRCGASSASSPAASGSSPAASDSSCQDKTPSGGVSCQQRKDWGQCSQSWLSSGGYCQATCGTCGGSSSSSSSDKSSPSPSPSSSSSGSDGSCSDNAPSGGTCAQQKQWGACDQSWMVSGNYCATTCGRCGSSSSSDNSGSSDSGSSSGSSDSSPSPSGSGDSSSSDSSPQVQSYSGPSGRRLLLL